MDGIDKLPDWAQIATFLGILIATTIATMGGWFKDKFVKNPAGSPSGPAVVMSAAIADSATLNTLATAINRLCDRLDNDAQDAAEDRRMLRNCIRDLLDASDRQTRTISNMVHPFGEQRIAPPYERDPNP